MSPPGGGIRDLWTQHNEHRLLIPKLIMVHLARLTNWDIRAELTLNLILALGAFSIIWRLITSTGDLLHSNLRLILIPLVSILFFSMNQWENWLWGWQIQIFICNLSVVAAILILSKSTISTFAFLTSIGLGAIAGCSFGSGNLIWPIGLIIISCHNSSNKSKYQQFILWLLIASIFLAVYFSGYRQTLPVYRMKRFLFEPDLSIWRAYFAYILTYIGAPLFPFNQSRAVLAGACGLLGLLLLSALTIKHHGKYFERVLPVIGIALYAVGAGFSTGLARAQMGTEQALSSRYISISTLFWISVLILTGIYFNVSGGNQITPRKLKLFNMVTACILLSVIFLGIHSSVQGRNRAARHHARLESIYVSIQEDRADDKQLQYLFPNVTKLRQYLAILRKRKLSLYHT